MTEIEPGMSESQLEIREDGRKILRFKQTRQRAKVLGWMILFLAVYQFMLSPFVAWLDPSYADFAKATSAVNVGVFTILCAWHCALLGIDGFKGGK